MSLAASGAETAASLQAEIDILEAAEAADQAKKRARSGQADIALDEVDGQIADSLLMDEEDAEEAPTRAGKKTKADAPMLRSRASGDWEIPIQTIQQRAWSPSVTLTIAHLHGAPGMRFSSSSISDL